MSVPPHFRSLDARLPSAAASPLPIAEPGVMPLTPGPLAAAAPAAAAEPTAARVDTVVDELGPAVRAFTLRLQKLPIGEWVELAARDANAEHVEPGEPDARARRRLRRIMDAHPHVVVRLRERISFTLAAADGFAPPSLLPRMHRVALTAALALAARHELAPGDFLRLYRPFAPVVPVEQLG